MKFYSHAILTQMLGNTVASQLARAQHGNLYHNYNESFVEKQNLPSKVYSTSVLENEILSSVVNTSETGYSSISSCIAPTVTITVTLPIGHPTYASPSDTFLTPHSTSSEPSATTPFGQTLDNVQTSHKATQRPTTELSSSLSLPQPSINSTCPTSPTNMPSMAPFFGLNVVNTKPQATGSPPYFKQPEDWERAFETIKNSFPDTNAVRIYSTTDVNLTEVGGVVPHLKNALPSAAKYNISILAGVWSGGIWMEKRFQTEIEALEAAVKTHGCDNIAAVSVGNEDLNDINKAFGWLGDAEKATRKEKTVDILVSQMSQVRQLLRRQGCCDTPVTHADTWNELFNREYPWVEKVNLRGIR